MNSNNSGKISGKPQRLHIPTPQHSLAAPGSSTGSNGGAQDRDKLEGFYASTPFNKSPSPVQNKLKETKQEADVNTAPVGYGMMLNRGESLLKSLSILSRIHQRDQEKQRLGRGSKGRQQPMNKGTTAKGRDEKLEPQSFTFTSDMFNTSNPQAFQHVTHLLFEMLDPKEIENVFRGCWPVYDRKQEAEYRKAAFNWATKIVEENPEFFPNCTLQFSLFVNPWGERFLRFMSLFVAFVMYSVAQRSQKPNEKPILKPTLKPTSEEKHTQIQQFDAARSELLEKSIITLQNTMTIVEKHNERKIHYAEALQEKEKILMNEKEKLCKIIQEKPELFSEGALELLESRGQKIRKEAKNMDWDPSNCSITEDSLSTVINKDWEQKLRQLNDTFSKVDEFCSRHVKLCKLIEGVESNGKVVLDGKKLSGLNQNNPDLGLYFQNIQKTLENLCTEGEQLKKPNDELIETINFQQERESFLAFRKGEINFNSDSFSTSQLHEASATEKVTIDDEQLCQEISFETKALQMELNNVKWDRLSKCESNTAPEEIFTWTPIRDLDIATTTVVPTGTGSTSSNLLDSHVTPKRRLKKGEQ